MATLRINGQHPVGWYWAQSEKTQWTFSITTISAFYLFGSLYTILFSLSKGEGNLFDEEISIPNWGCHWS